MCNPVKAIINDLYYAISSTFLTLSYDNEDFGIFLCVSHVH